MIKEFKKSISRIEFSELVANGKSLGWNAYLFDHNNVTVAGGTSRLRETALRIGYAELIEREIFKKICGDPILKQEFLIPLFPTTCGFACGFSDAETKQRAILEAIERWAWSKWIDEQISIPQHNYIRNDNFEIANYFLEKFDNFKFYIMPINFNVDSGVKLFFCAFLGFKNEGVFLGSRVSDSYEDLISHSVIEGHRAQLISNSPASSARAKDFFLDRVLFFSKNANLIPDFGRFEKVLFPTPELMICKKYESEDGEFFVYRALMKEFLAWNEGDNKRFVY